MDPSVAQWLTSPDAERWLAEATGAADPSSLGLATRLRRDLDPARAAAVTEQATLRRRARAKFGAQAEELFFTPAGLEQATRPVVAARRAERFAARGVRRVVDLGCGLATDAAACVRAGLGVSGVELDAVTAVFARANLAVVSQTVARPPDVAAPVASENTAAEVARSGASAPTVEVIAGDVLTVAPRLLGTPDPEVGVFCDPARRTDAGRTWRVEQFTPPWGFVESLLDGSRVACVKLGPGVPLGLIPDAVEAEWISDRGDVVECALWSGSGAAPGLRRAVVDGAELTRPEPVEPPLVGEVGEWLYEPDGAVIRAQLVPALAERLGAWRLHDGVAYLTADAHLATPFATVFRVVEVLPYAEKTLRAWVRERRVGVLEIKKRGIDVDPAVLRKKLKPSGPNAATLVLTPTASGAVALVCERA